MYYSDLMIQQAAESAMDRFRSDQQWVNHLECHCCGYEPGVEEPPPGRCPKCGGSAWDKYEVQANPPVPAEPDADQEDSLCGAA